ncbi:hypothetical protein GpartN1_g231.t1 [Galdieria partita]|uniref:TPPC8 first Ig-like domain-containing protein n=1 Tax=Galdieria partita TaxID=83374 RepID=A0A9C7UM68_9RHOD|nr:hypothetical protein GpartN1_g231.t1 [Galdieria partita]
MNNKTVEEKRDVSRKFSVTSFDLLKDEIQSRHKPIVLVCATQAANHIAKQVLQSCKISGWNCAALLSQLAKVQCTPVNISHFKKQTEKAFEDFKVRFVSIEELCKQEGDEFDGTLINALEEERLDHIGEQEESYRKTYGYYKQNGRSFCCNEPVWYTLYRDYLESLLVTSEYHSFGQPVAVVVVGWVGEGEELGTNIEKILPKASTISSVYEKEILELDAPQCFLLLERGSVDSSATGKALTQLRKIYGPSVGKVLSIPDMDIQLHSSDNDQAHNCQSKQSILDDVDNGSSIARTGSYSTKEFHSITTLGLDPHISSLVGDLIRSFIVASIEQRLLTLYRLVERLRRGVRNQIKALFRTDRGPREGVVGGGLHSSFTYLAFSAESRVRQLADILFMLGEYEEAIEYYRLASHDFKADQAFPYFAKSEEMIALCLIMLNGSPKEIMRHFNTAIENFLLAKVPNEATRTCLYASDYFLTMELKEDLGTLLLKTCTMICLPSQFKSVHVRAAVLYERAALCYLVCGRWRRHAFQLVRAGFRFRQANMYRHALRVYLDAYYSYQALGWTRIESHLCTIIGHIYFQLGQFMDAAKYLSQLQLFVKERFDKQVSHLVDLFNVSRQLKHAETTNKEEFLVDFPVVLDKRTFIETFDYPSYISDEEYSKWSSLECSLVELAERWDKSSKDSTKSSSLPSSPRRIRQKVKRLTMTPLPQKESWRQPVPCIAEETFYLIIEVDNPLQVPLLLFDLDIIFQFTKKGDSMMQLHTRHQESEHRFLELSDSALEILPGSVQQIRVELKPLCEGFLSIQGICWSFRILYDSIVEKALNNMPASEANLALDSQAFCRCRHMFHLRGPRMNETKEQRTSTTPIYEKNHALELIVFPSSPSLICRFVDVPVSLYHGQTVEGAIELVNYGRKPLENIFYEAESFSWLYVDTDSTNKEGLSSVNAGHLPVHLDCGQSTRIKCYLRAAELASVPKAGIPKVYHLVFCIQVGRDRTTHRWRICRCPWNVHILPSLLHYPRFLRVSRHRSGTYLIGVEIEHADPSNDEHFQVLQVGILSKGDYRAFALQKMSPKDDGLQVLLKPNETATVFFYVKKTAVRDSTYSVIDLESQDSYPENYQKPLEWFFAEEYSHNFALPSDHIIICLHWKTRKGTKGILLDNSLSLRRCSSQTDYNLAITTSKQQTAVDDNRENLMIQCYLEFPSEVTYNFKACMQPVVVPVSAVFRSLFRDNAIDIHVRALPASIAEASRGRRWRGHITANLLSIPPGGQRTIQLDAIFPCEGVYDAGEISAICNNTSLQFEGNSRIHVVSSNSMDQVDSHANKT